MPKVWMAKEKNFLEATREGEDEVDIIFFGETKDEKYTY